MTSKNDVILLAFQKLSRKIGLERVIWRNAPILFNNQYMMNYHITFFRQLARRLEGYTRKVHHQLCEPVSQHSDQHEWSGLCTTCGKEIIELAQRLADIAGKHHLVLETCAEQIDLEPYGIAHGHCIDRALL